MKYLKLNISQSQYLLIWLKLIGYAIYFKDEIISESEVQVTIGADKRQPIFRIKVTIIHMNLTILNYFYHIFF